MGPAFCHVSGDSSDCAFSQQADATFRALLVICYRCTCKRETLASIRRRIISHFFCRPSFFRQFRRAFASHSPFTNIRELTQVAHKKFSESNFFAVDPHKYPNGTDEHQAQYTFNLLLAHLINELLFGMGKKLQAILRSGKLDLYFIISIAYSFVLTLFTFSFVFFGLSKALPASFIPAGNGDWLVFLGASLDNMLPATHSGMVPALDITIFLGYLQSTLSLVIIVLFVFLLFNSLRERYRQDVGSTITELQSLNKTIARKIEENFSLTLYSIERLLLRDNPLIIGFVMQFMRGSEYTRIVFEESKSLDIPAPQKDLSFKIGGKSPPDPNGTALSTGD